MTSREIFHPGHADPFRRFSTRVWQNPCVNTVRHAIVCNVYFSFSKIFLILLKVLI